MIVPTRPVLTTFVTRERAGINTGPFLLQHMREVMTKYIMTTHSGPANTKSELKSRQVKSHMLSKRLLKVIELNRTRLSWNQFQDSANIPEFVNCI